MSKKESTKYRIYAGQLITSENYNNFEQPQRLFWQKAHKAFNEGKTFFKHKGQEFVVPFKLADDSFNSVLAKERFETILDNKTEDNNEIGSTGDTEIPSPDSMAGSIV